MNRHKGWSKEICEQKQFEYRNEYSADKEREERFFQISCVLQENIRRGQCAVHKVNKADDPEDKLKYALWALELILCEEGLAKQNGSSPLPCTEDAPEIKED